MPGPKPFNFDDYKKNILKQAAAVMADSARGEATLERDDRKEFDAAVMELIDDGYFTIMSDRPEWKLKATGRLWRFNAK